MFKCSRVLTCHVFRYVIKSMVCSGHMGCLLSLSLSLSQLGSRPCNYGFYNEELERYVEQVVWRDPFPVRLLPPMSVC